MAIGGVGILATAGSDDGKLARRWDSPQTTPVPGLPRDLDAGYLTGNGLTLGQSETTGITKSRLLYVRGARETQERMQRDWQSGFIYEYRVNGDFSVDCGQATFLWPNIDVIFSDSLPPSKFGGTRCLEAAAVPALIDSSQVTTTTLVAGEGTGRGSTVKWGVSGTSSPVIWNLDGTQAANILRLVDDPEQTTTALAQVAAVNIQQRFETGTVDQRRFGQIENHHRLPAAET